MDFFCFFYPSFMDVVFLKSKSLGRIRQSTGQTELCRHKRIRDESLKANLKNTKRKKAQSWNKTLKVQQGLCGLNGKVDKS